MLAKLVKSGQLPPLKERLPDQPKIITPRERLGCYCDTWRMAIFGAGNLGGVTPRTFYTSLIHWSMDWQSLEAGIAEKWEISPDGRRFTFYLRKGLKFSDGHPFTTEDIEFSLNHLLFNKKILLNTPGWLMQNGKSAQFERVSPSCFRFIFPESNGTFILYITVESHYLFSPKHYLENFMPPFISEQKADSIAAANGYAKWNSFVEMVLRHPYRNPDLPVLLPWRRITPREKAETRWVFERNPYYYAVDSSGRQLPYFDRVEITNVSDPEQIYLKIVTGEIDCQSRHIEGDHTRLLLKNRQRGDYQVQFYPFEWYPGIFFNQTEAGDSIQCQLNRTQNFRLALSLAIDREEIHKLLNWGQGDDLKTLTIPPGYENDPDILRWYHFDPVEANRLLDELGLHLGADGWRRRPDGKNLVLTVYIIDYLPFDHLELVQEYWQAVGVKLNIKKISYRSWWDFVNAFKFDLVAYIFTMPTDRTLILFPYHIIPYYASTYWGGKWGLWYESNGQTGEEPPPEVKELFTIWEKIKREMNADRQMELLNLLRYQSLKMGHTLLIKTVLPGMNIVKNNFYNVGQGYPHMSWPKRAPGPDFPETYFMQ